MGFHAANRIGVLKTDSDIDVTWEGDNSVLLQVRVLVVPHLNSLLAS